MNGNIVFSVGSAPHKSSVDTEIMGWLGMSEPKETGYRKKCVPALCKEAADKSVFDLLPMDLPLPFNHGLPVGYSQVRTKTRTSGSTHPSSTVGQK
jgi:hypothetical protein